MLKYILLGFLQYRSMTGYDLKSMMEQSTMHFWHAYHSQIYTTLRKLEEEGLVTSETDESDDKLTRRVYTLTSSGQVALTNWLREPMTEMVEMKESLLVRVFFSAGRSPQAVIDELVMQRQLHQRKLAEYLTLENAPLEMLIPNPELDLAPHIPYWRSTLKFGIAYEKLYLDWIDETLSMLQAQRD